MAHNWGLIMILQWECCISEEVLTEHLSSNALRTPLWIWRRALIPAPGADDSRAAPTSTFITKLLDHYGLRLSFTAFDFFCCQMWGKWCVIWSKMLLFVLIYCFNILWLPAITLPWQGCRDPWRWCKTGICWAFWGFGPKCGHACSLQWGTQPNGHWRSPGRRMAWALDKLNWPPTPKKSLISSESQQVLARIWGPKPSWAWGLGQFPKTQLGIIEERHLTPGSVSK